MVELRFSNPVSGLPATLVFGEREAEFFANVTARRTFAIEVGSDFTPVPMVRRYGQFDILSGANASFYGAAAVKATLNISGDSAFAPVGKFRKAYTMHPGVSYVFTPTKELFVLKTPSNRT